MSCNYADGLSPYENKGILGVPERFETIEKLEKKCQLLAEMISKSKHVVVHTGAGISTSAGIPDFRGPKGVWTLEKEGKKPDINVSFIDAKPTKTHMILKKLVDSNKVHYVVSQNIDGLHLKSGLSRKYLAELHGNMFVDECNVCKRQFVRSTPVETVGKKVGEVPCPAARGGGRACRGRLADGILDWEHSLPDNDLYMAETHSSIADLSICLGTTLQIVPSGNLPLETLKYGGQLVICNLQPTKHDNKADLLINYYVDDILERVMNILQLDIPQFNETDNPLIQATTEIVDWTINRKYIVEIEKIYKVKCKGVKKKRILVKSRQNSVDDKDNVTKLRKVTLENGKRNSVALKSKVGKPKSIKKEQEQATNNDCEIKTEILCKNDDENVNGNNEITVCDKDQSVQATVKLKDSLNVNTELCDTKCDIKVFS